FGAVLAVSHAKSPKRKDLIYAANLTDIGITIPEQPVWTDDDLRAFRSEEKSRIRKGSALAWMGHLNTLKWYGTFITHCAPSLTLEDDIDWDIRLCTSQIPLAAASIRQLLSNSTSSLNLAPTTYWGSLSSWEILYLGHCGDHFHASQLQKYPYQAYQNTSLPLLSHLDPKTAQFVTDPGLPEFTRIAYRSYWPLCTFAYAVTCASAQRILEAYRYRDWECYTVNPELLHHVEGVCEIVNADFGFVKDGSDGNGNTEKARGTRNIACGARRKGILN
ncbi:glycosyltransferase family 25 protein, partial [Zopfia rhizophila CBS 207.26]